MQRFIAVAENGFAFGEPDKVVLKNYAYLEPKDCVLLDQVHRRVNDPKYGHRYKLLWDAITGVLPETRSSSRSSEIYVALVILSHGPILADIRVEYINTRTWISSREGLASGGIQLQFYMPSAEGQLYSILSEKKKTSEF